MADYGDAQDALYDAIHKLTAEAINSNATAGVKAANIKELALAFRYVAGGEQPGS